MFEGIILICIVLIIWWVTHKIPLATDNPMAKEIDTTLPIIVRNISNELLIGELSVSRSIKSQLPSAFNIVLSNIAIPVVKTRGLKPKIIKSQNIVYLSDIEMTDGELSKYNMFNIDGELLLSR